MDDRVYALQWKALVVGCQLLHCYPVPVHKYRCSLAICNLLMGFTRKHEGLLHWTPVNNIQLLWFSVAHFLINFLWLPGVNVLFRKIATIWIYGPTFAVYLRVICFNLMGVECCFLRNPSWGFNANKPVVIFLTKRTVIFSSGICLSTPPKTNKSPLKRDYFSRECILQLLSFKGHSLVFSGILGCPRKLVDG